MPRRNRSDLTGFPLHIIQRGNNRAACFLTDADRAAYLHWLTLYAGQLAVHVHAWVLMTNHVHLLVTPPATADSSRLMQSLGSRYVAYFNEAHARSGTLWEGRFRACPVHAEAYLFVCMRYIEMNPVRGGLVDRPEDYKWSSYRSNALGGRDALVTTHSLYADLGPTPAARQEAYRDLFLRQPSETVPSEIRAATGSGYLLASKSFRSQLEASKGMTLGPSPRGRPKSRAEA